MKRKKALSFLPPALLVLVGLLVSGRPAAAEESCVSGACHAALVKAKTVHPATESCEACHESVTTPHPVAGQKTFKLTQEPPGLCFACHDPFGKKGSAHVPVQEGMCTVCHSPHASDHAKLLLKPGKELCLDCHEDVITKTMTTLHGPIRDGECTPCHDPHGSPYAKLLRKEFPARPYVPYTDAEFELCFGCHDRALLRDPDTSPATGFRDGERNLHYLHVNNAQKGRSCTLCHDVHGSSAPKLLAESVPFGQWKLPLRFVKTETGGGCAPGCHKPYSYDRQSPRNKPAPRAPVEKPEGSDQG